MLTAHTLLGVICGKKYISRHHKETQTMKFLFLILIMAAGLLAKQAYLSDEMLFTFYKEANTKNCPDKMVLNYNGVGYSLAFKRVGYTIKKNINDELKKGDCFFSSEIFMFNTKNRNDVHRVIDGEGITSIQQIHGDFLAIGVFSGAHGGRLYIFKKIADKNNTKEFIFTPIEVEQTENRKKTYCFFSDPSDFAHLFKDINPITHIVEWKAIILNFNLQKQRQERIVYKFNEKMKKFMIEKIDYYPYRKSMAKGSGDNGNSSPPQQ